MLRLRGQLWLRLGSGSRALRIHRLSLLELLGLRLWLRLHLWVCRRLRLRLWLRRTALVSRWGWILVQHIIGAGVAPCLSSALL